MKVKIKPQPVHVQGLKQKPRSGATIVFEKKDEKGNPFWEFTMSICEVAEDAPFWRINHVHYWNTSDFEMEDVVADCVAVLLKYKGQYPQLARMAAKLLQEPR